MRRYKSTAKHLGEDILLPIPHVHVPRANKNLNSSFGIPSNAQPNMKDLTRHGACAANISFFIYVLCAPTLLLLSQHFATGCIKHFARPSCNTNLFDICPQRLAQNASHYDRDTYQITHLVHCWYRSITCTQHHVASFCLSFRSKHTRIR